MEMDVTDWLIEGCIKNCKNGKHWFIIYYMDEQVKICPVCGKKKHSDGSILDLEYNAYLALTPDVTKGGV